MPITRVNGIRLYWEISGNGGEPMVLVHGSWGDHKNWASVVPSLSQSFRVLTYDRRGHSQSERSARQGSVRDDVADLAALLDELGHRPAHIVGNSFGACIVLRLAAARPDLFRSLIVHEPPLFALLRDQQEWGEILAAVQQRVSAVVSLLEAGHTTEGARHFIETIAFGPGAWSKLPEEVRNTFIFNAPTWLDEFHDPDAPAIELSDLREFSSPTLLTIGDQSAPFFAPVVHQVAKAIPRATVRTYTGAGHVPHLSHPGDYVRAVAEFTHASAA